MSEAKEYEAGETVQLKSGGPVMTVEEIRGDDTVACVWFDSLGNGTLKAVFQAAMLRPVP